jgi:DNA-binding LytR/AlgR family response regulator
VDYLVKPFSLERFLKAAQKALELKLLKDKAGAEKPESGHFYVKCNGRLERINYDDLLYIQAMANYITLYTTNGKLVVYLTVKGILDSLPKEKFIQVHKSSIVNVDKINSIDGNTLHIGDARITVSLSFQDTVMKEILKDRFLKR